MEKKDKAPQIRFKGYTDDWEQRKVTDLGEIYIGLVTTMTEHYTDKGHLLIRNSDIKDGYFEFGENLIYLDDEFSEQNKSRMHQLGDVITVHTGDIGTSAVIGENEVNSIGFATIVTRPNQEVLDSNYFATYLNTDTHKQWAISMATGDGRSNYNLKDYTKLVVPIPQMEEQKKIAAFVGNLNKFITLHQRKYDKLVNIKKSMLEKMFPKRGAKVPEIRFKGYTDDWEQRKLDDWGFFYYGKSCPKWSVTEEATIPCIRYGELYTKFGAKIDRVYSYTNIQPENLRFSKGTEVLIPRVGEDPMDYNHCTWLSMPDIAIGEMISVFNTENNPLFTATMFNATLQNEFAMRVEGGSVTNLYFEKLKNIEVSFPSIAEQEKIAAYFEGLDHLITLHQRKLEKLRNIKKACLEKMFV